MFLTESSPQSVALFCMKITFQKRSGRSDLNLSFFWRLDIDEAPSVKIQDLFIPELFFDYVLVQRGHLRIENQREHLLLKTGQQGFFSLRTRPLFLTYEPPITLFGARFERNFAPLLWDSKVLANDFSNVVWLKTLPVDLASFADHLRDTVAGRRKKATIAPLQKNALEAAEWLSRFSARHKRRLIKKTYGLSQKEMKAVENLHAFLTRACDFSTQNPRIIEYIDSDVFYDQPHLNRAFKKMTGLTPMDYFEARSILQDNLMAASYNAISA